MKSYVVLALLVAHSAFAAHPTPPDLAVVWSKSSAVVSGAAGETIEIGYVIRNLGGRDAFAVISRVSTTLGPIPRARIQPGPEAGKSVERVLSLPLAVGMSELCIEVILQNVSLDDPSDPNLKNNRACRPVAVREPK